MLCIIGSECDRFLPFSRVTMNTLWMTRNKRVYIYNRCNPAYPTPSAWTPPPPTFDKLTSINFDEKLLLYCCSL